MTALHRRSQGVKAKNANARRSRGNRTRQRFCITRERGCRLQLRAVNAWAIGRGARYRRGCSPGSPDQPGVQSIPFLPMASRKRTSQTTNRGSTPRSRNISSRGQIPRVAQSWLALAAAVENRTLELLPGLRGSTTPKLLVWGEDDQFQTVDHAERFAAEIPATRLVRIRSAGHIPMENAPRAVAGALAAFFAER